jgi:hypothetical protein
LLLLRAIKSLTELHLDDSSLFAFNALSLLPKLQVHFHTLAGGSRYMFSRLLNIVSSEYQKCLFFARGETAKALFLASHHSGNTRNAIQNGLAAPDACTLGWPRSDLAKENIAIRKRERTSWDDIGE